MVRFPTALSGSTTLALLAVSLLVDFAATSTTAQSTPGQIVGGHADTTVTTTTQFASNKEENEENHPSQRQEREEISTTKTDVNITEEEEGDMTCDDDNKEHQDEIISEESTYANVASSSDVMAAAAVVKDYGAEFGKVQTMEAADAGGDMLMTEIEFNDTLQSMYTYMKEIVFVDEKYKNVKDICKNQHESCAVWAAWGECENNPGYMHLNCAPVCQTCELLHVETRCPLDPNVVDVFAKPGDVNKLFTRILSDPFYKQFGPKVLSRPDLAPGDTKETADYKVGGPWMLLFENAITDEEADQLIELGGTLGYEPSADVGERKADGTYGISVNNGRTSTNAWCVDECNEDPIAQTVMNRIVNITGIPEANSEDLQLLRYEKDQYYKVHTDYIDYQTERPSGVRILTFFFYLNNVEQGGETSFPNIGLTVQPKKGQAILWPSVLDQDPNKADRRTDHTALPVIQGVKYGVNAWLHQRDFKTPHRAGC